MRKEGRKEGRKYEEGTKINIDQMRMEGENKESIKTKIK